MKLIFLILTIFMSFSTVAATCTVHDDSARAKQASKACEVAISSAKVSQEELQKLAEQWNLPSGSLDGVESNDLVFQTFKQILGDPFAKVTHWTSTPDDTAPSGQSAGDVTVTTSLLAIMSGIGVITVTISLLGSLFAMSFRASSTGAFVGKDGGSALAFIRSGLGYIGSFPQPSFGGLSLAQLVIIFMIIVSCGFASAIFRFGVDKAFREQVVLADTGARTDVFLSAVRGLHCLDTQKALGLIDESQANVKVTVSSANVLDTAASAFTRETFTTHVKEFDFGVCGNIQINYPRESNVSNPDAEEVRELLHNAVEMSIGKALDNLIRDESVREANQALISAADFAGTEFVAPSEFNEKIAQAYVRFKNDLRSAMRNTTFQNRLKDFDQGLLANYYEMGFAVAGSSVYLISQRQEMINSALQDAVEPVDAEIGRGSLLDRFFGRSTYSKAYKAENAKLAVAIRDLISQPNSSQIAADLNELYHATTTDSFISAYLGTGLHGLMNLILNTGESREAGEFVDPLMKFRTIGNYLMGVPATLTAGNYAINGLLDAIGIDNEAQERTENNGEASLTEKASTMLIASGTQLVIYAGVFLSQAVPAIPFVLFNAALFGYIILGITTIAIAPISLVSTSENDGYGVRRFGMLCALLFARAPIMVIGLFVGYAVSIALFWLYDGMFSGVMQMMQSGGFSLASAIGIPFLYCTGGILILYKSYALINDIAVAFNKALNASEFHTDFNETSAQRESEQSLSRASAAAESAFGAVRR